MQGLLDRMGSRSFIRPVMVGGDDRVREWLLDTTPNLLTLEFLGRGIRLS